MIEDLNQLEAQLQALQEQVKAKREDVRARTLNALRTMLASGTLTNEDLRSLLPKTNKGRPKALAQRSSPEP
jgi:cytosine/adenosine deaminase-related metal-dependent hydrolase